MSAFGGQKAIEDETATYTFHQFRFQFCEISVPLGGNRQAFRLVSSVNIRMNGLAVQNNVHDGAPDASLEFHLIHGLGHSRPRCRPADMVFRTVIMVRASSGRHVNGSRSASTDLRGSVSPQVNWPPIPVISSKKHIMRGIWVCIMYKYGYCRGRW